MGQHPPFKEVESSRPDFGYEESFHYTKTPQPDWKPGQGISNAPLKHREIYTSPGPIKTFIPYENLSAPDCYKLLINTVVPRPIALCSTLSLEGRPNLAPFSYFNAVSSNPPALMVSFTKSSTGEKDSALNIKNTKDFVVAIISEPFIEAANYTAIDAPPEVSEWDLSGLKPQPSIKVKPARVQQASINMECQLEHFHELFDPADPSKLTQTIIIGIVKAWHIREEILVDGGPTVSAEKLMPMSRLGGISYARVNSGIELTRPVWEVEKKKPEVQKVLLENQIKK